ncbi:MAG TPA: (Fe-S)-binding protein [Bacteroidales bacterium]|nr:(Fe-S)-binding protein [Bacteroidales bacterium]HRZ47948.1 (Fe-S)-binding protein [Bacteroidales bacterium]
MDQEKKQKALKILSDHRDSKLLTQLSSCVHCGLCAESCHYYLAFREDKYIPARKVELVTSIWRRYNTFAGKHFPGLMGAHELDDLMAEELTDQLFGACSLCNRCVPHCSIGVDIAYLVRTGRAMLSEMGMVPATLQATVNAALETGNNMAIPEDEFTDTIEWMEEELTDEFGDNGPFIPLNQPGKHVLYTLNPREPKFFPLSIAAMARIFYAAGESWTLSTRMYDVTNYAFFSCNREDAAIIAQRLVDEVKAMGAARCVLAECGHGSRAFRWEAPNYLGQPFPFETLTNVELMLEYLEQGRIKVDPSKNPGVFTLHDPCNLVRSGGIIEPQRKILKASVGQFVEMTPNRADNYCCGGGGGQLAMSEYNERRMKIAEIKADQIRKTGASVVVTPCHNCVDQLMQINAWYKLNVQVKTLAEVVSDALIFD